MWFIKKAGEFIAPIITTNSFEEFQIACTDALSNIAKPDMEDTIAFIGALNNIQDYLSEEINLDERPCLDYFVSESILQKIVNSIDENLPNPYIEPIFNFFTAFVSTDLNKHFLQVTVHRPFSKLLTLLDVLYMKEPTETRNFASNLWTTVRPSSIMLEMMSIDKKLPLLDFFFSFVFSPGRSNDYARDAILSIVSKRAPELPSIFFDYIRDNLYPKIVDFIIQITECVTTIQFNGSYTSLLMWIDNILSLATGFPTDKLFERILKYDDSKQMLTISLLLSFFMSPDIYNKSLEISQTEIFIDKVIQGLQSEQEFSRKASITLLKTLLRCNTECEFIIPTVRTEAADVLSILPPEWLIQIDGSTAMEAYETDAITRINFYGIKRMKGNDAKNTFPHILKLLSNFKGLSIQLCLSLSELILMILANAPDMIAEDLAKSYEEAVQQYIGVQFFQMPNAIKDFTDSPEVRAALLTEFGKEIHATFIASEKIKANVEIINNDQ